MARSSTRPGQMTALVDALLRDCDIIVTAIDDRLQRELPAYTDLPAEVLELGIRAEVERVLRSARAGQAAASEAELAELAEIGELRARQGVPVETMLRAWRIGIQVVIAHSREAGERMGIGASDLVELIESLLAWSDVAMVTTAAAHRRAELEVARQEQEYRTNLVHSVLLGTVGSSDIAVQAASYGVDVTREYVAVRARPATDSSHRDLERALGFHEAVQHRRGLSALLDGDLAGFLRERPPGAPPGVVGVGPPRPLDRLAESFRLATRALLSADAFGLTGVHDISSLGLRCAVVADGDVGEALCQRYLDPLAASGSASEIIDSLRAYFDCGMRVEAAAARLYVHSNTLRYRLARFEELTGASLRDPGVGFEVWWALQRAAMRAGA